MFIGYMPIISAYYPMKGLFQCPLAHKQPFFIQLYYLKLNIIYKYCVALSLVLFNKY